MHKKWVEWFEKTDGKVEEVKKKPNKASRAEKYQVELGEPIKVPNRETLGVANSASKNYQNQIDRPFDDINNNAQIAVEAQDYRQDQYD